MSIRARVGRHTRSGGRHCQNWADDQRTVIDLLNRISVADGGAGGGLGGRIVAGICDDALYGAISQFEDKYFPGQHSGFLDPGGAMLKRMEQLAGRAASAGPRVIVESVVAVARSRLDILRDNLLDETPVIGAWSAGDRVAFDPLVKLALKHIENLKDMRLNKLPWPAEMFGRAYVTKYDPMPTLSAFAAKDEWFAGWRAPKLRFLSSGDTENMNSEDWTGSRHDEAPPLPEMKYGNRVDMNYWITTANLGALLLFDTGECFRVAKYRYGRIDYAKDSLRYNDPGLGPKPIE